jgi:cysteine desulfuration protein SufE
MSKSIQEIQDEIIEEFALLDGDQEMTNFYIMELGQKLPDMEESLKTEDNIIKGCQSKVWVVPRTEDDALHFLADSNSAITKGLVSLLIRIFDHQRAEDILNAELYFIDKIGMNRFIGTQRSNGFAAMIKQIRLFALVHKDRIEANQ